MTDQGLLTADQVGERLGVDRSTVYRMAGDGRLEAVKVGRQWRFPADRLADLLHSPQVASPPPPARVHVDATAWTPLLELVAESLGVMLVITDMTGDPVTPVVNPCSWFAARADDPEMVAECTEEWRAFALDADLTPRFRTGRHGFQCASTFLRSGSELVGMVLVGGVQEPAAVAERTDEGFYDLDDASRARVLANLPRLSAALSRLVGHPARPEAAPTARPLVRHVHRRSDRPHFDTQQGETS